VRALAICASSALALAGAASAQTVTGFAGVRYGSGNTTHDEVELELANDAAQSLGPVANESPPPGDPENPGTESEQEAVLSMDLGAGFLAMATGSAGQVLGYGVTRFGVGTTRVDYRENVLVESASVADGTPVVIRLRYRIAFGRECFHDLTPTQLEAVYPTHGCLTDLELRATLNDLLGEVDSDSQNHFVNVGFEPTVTGLFANPRQFGELTVTAAVGDAVRLELFADAAGVHRLGGPYQETFPGAATGTSLALVFGVESDTPGVEIVSPLLGGALPGFAGVTAAHAQSRALAVATGAPVVVPEPNASVLALIACAVLLARRRGAPPYATGSR